MTHELTNAIAAEVLEEAKKEKNLKAEAEQKVVVEKICSELAANLVESVQAVETKSVAIQVYRWCALCFSLTDPSV